MRGLLLLCICSFFMSAFAADCKEKFSDRTKSPERMLLYLDCLEAHLEASAKNEVPQGTIVMWSGNMHQIPKGWALCDGRDGRPNLQDRFVLGAGAHYPIGETGGSFSHDHDSRTHQHTLSVDEIPPHTHKMGTGGTDTSQMAPGGATQRLPHFISDQYNGGDPKATHNDGGGGKGHGHEIRADDHIPPYYALAFIIKL